MHQGSYIEQKAKKRHLAALKYYRKLHKVKVDLKYIADYFGQCETSLGAGYAYQCIRDHNGDVSQTLENYFKDADAEPQKIYPLLQKLGRYLVENRILISDIHARNILLQKNSQGEITPIIVDGIGDRVAITVLNISPKLAISKIIRRWNRFSRKELDSNAHIT